jgi:hypothetical protein
MSPDLTIVTACDANYFWGAFLLAASLRIHGVSAPIHVLAQGFSEDQKNLLLQFPDTAVIPLAEGNPRNLCTRKAEALLTANTEWVAWIDADSIAVGDLRPVLIPKNDSFQIRMRSPQETAEIYRNFYEPDETPGGIPRKIASQWKADVADLEKPACVDSCVTNVFVIHQRHRRFLELWNEQILKVIPPVHNGITRWDQPAYLISDESVLNSLLAFSSLAPRSDEYLLDRQNSAHVLHFVENPKPWGRWKHRHWSHYEKVLGLLDQARAEGYRLPPLPWPLRRQLKPLAFALSLADRGVDAGKSMARGLMRR